MFGLSGNRGSHVDQGHARKAKKEALTAASMVFLHGIRKDGIAYVGAGWWSATALISDVNYQLASVDTRKKILNAWMSTLNMFDENTRIQVTSANRMLNGRSVTRGVYMDAEGRDGLDSYRRSFNELAADQLKGLASSTVTDKYITVSVKEIGQDKAVVRLNRLLSGLKTQLVSMSGCTAHRLDRGERLRVLGSMLQPDEPFTFSEKLFEQAPKNMRAKDFVTPWSMDFRNKDQITLSSRSETFMTHVWLGGMAGTANGYPYLRSGRYHRSDSGQRAYRAMGSRVRLGKGQDEAGRRQGRI